MKQIILTLGIIFLFANIAFGFVLDSFDTFNVIFSSGAIVTTTIIHLLVNYIKMKDAFKVSLYLINYVALITILTFQLVLLTATNITSKKIN